MFEIKNIEQLLQPHIGENNTIKKYETTRLTKPGENYGSLILALEVTIQKENGKEEILHLVAKQLPENQLFRKLFQVELTFGKELNMYKIILPTLNQFLKEQGIQKEFDAFPKFFGGRFSLDKNAVEPDEDAIIILENLIYNNFKTVDRKLGFNLAEAELILKDLAVFHALPIALKSKKPEIYDEILKPHLQSIDMFKTCTPEQIEDTKRNICNICKLNGIWDKYPEKITLLLNDLTKWVEEDNEKSNPFYSINHCDLWVNNTMLKFENDKVIQNKLVDFQIIQEGFVGNDIIFFIYSSVQTSIMEEQFDHLIDIYFNTFIEILVKLECDVSKYTVDAFRDNLNKTAKKQVWHALFMLQPIFANEGDVKELKDYDEDEFFQELPITVKRNDKCRAIILNAVNRNWL